MLLMYQQFQQSHLQKIAGRLLPKLTQSCKQYLLQILLLALTQNHPQCHQTL